ncbi:pyruvate transporter [Trichosporon asahii var. asahii CBS 8904]|uniref:Pyruvate transporter n=1 Tax=Trichosporon asahii var. asahii (strain CBS 8904) TaxID=1220162 RepID=K1WB26_TRIAC|nr:pyruvate transporter [Trichosporon asahii var. asahii CBS 8904]
MAVPPYTNSHSPPPLQHPKPTHPAYPPPEPPQTPGRSSQSSPYSARLSQDADGYARYSSPPVGGSFGDAGGAMGNMGNMGNMQGSGSAYTPQQGGQHPHQRAGFAPAGPNAPVGYGAQPAGFGGWGGMNDATAQMGMQFGKSAISAGQDYVEKNADGGGVESYAPPREDINAPDLYIPSMALVTYTLLSAFASGIQERFHPEVLGYSLSKSLAVVILEFLAIKLGCYFLDVRGGGASSVELLAYGGYKFIGIIATVVMGLLNFGTVLTYTTFFYTFFANAFFLPLASTLPPGLAIGPTSSAGSRPPTFPFTHPPRPQDRRPAMLGDAATGATSATAGASSEASSSRSRSRRRGAFLPSPSPSSSSLSSETLSDPVSAYYVASISERIHNIHHINLGQLIPHGMHSMIAGMGAGLVSSIATCPLDVVKTTLQAQSAPRGDPGYEGVTKTCLRIYRQNGLKGFYRGLGPTIAGYLPTWGIYFTVYDFVKDRMKNNAAMASHPDLAHIISAMLAGASGTILTNPLWVVKTRFMAQAILPPDAPKYRSTFDGFRTIFRNEGLAAFYKGLIPSLFGISHVAVQFTLYEKAKAWAAHGSPDPLTPSAILLCSALSKMIASLATYPHEVLRTRIQMQKKPRQLPKPPVQPHIEPTPHTYSPLLAGSQPPLEEGKVPKKGGRRGIIPPTIPSSLSEATVHEMRPEAAPRPSTGHAPMPAAKAVPAARAEPAFTTPGEPSKERVTRVSPPTVPRDARGAAFAAEAELTEATREARANTLRPYTSDPPKRAWPRKGGIIDVFIKIYRQDGWRGFYRGLSINLVRTVPASAVTMLTYELIMRNLSKGAARAAAEGSEGEDMA